MRLFHNFVLLFCLNGALLCQTAVTKRKDSQPKYSTWMLDSIMSRGQGIIDTEGLTSSIGNGLFQEATRAAIAQSHNQSQIEQWTEYLNRSVLYNLTAFNNATQLALVPLDRLSEGTSLMHGNFTGQAAQDALKNLRRSLDLQLRNENGGLWYFANPPPPYINYGNLSYDDGMYSFAPFSTLYGLLYDDPNVNLNFTAFQLDLLYQHDVRNDTGLLVHGYNANFRAPWATAATGASPTVWGRSMGWYMVGAVDSLEIADASETLRQTQAYATVRRIAYQLGHAIIDIIKKSAQETGRYGIWQVADQPGKDGNYVESSSTALLTYALSKSLRYGYLNGSTHSNSSCDKDIKELLQATYKDMVDYFVIENANNTLSFNGTVTICSLEQPDPYYDYYVGRPTVLNSILGTAAFVLASLAVENME